VGVAKGHGGHKKIEGFFFRAPRFHSHARFAFGLTKFVQKKGSRWSGPKGPGEGVGAKIVG